jgi:integrase
MASIATSPDGLVRILFSAGGSRRTLYCGRLKPKAAVVVKSHVEALLDWPRCGVLPPSTSAWVAALDDEMHSRLVRAGLLPEQAARERRTVRTLLDRVRETRAHWTPGTVLVFNTSRASIEAHLGADTPIEAVTPDLAEGFDAFLASKGLAPATRSKRIGVAKQAFARAVRWKWLAENPFLDVRCGPQRNEGRLHYVGLDVVRKVLAEIRDPDVRLAVALARLAGLRAPSEVLALRWTDLSGWNAQPQTMTVTSPKTARLAGGGSRVVPVLPALSPFLLEAWERAQPGAVYLLEGPRRGGCLNWRRAVEVACTRAGVPAWPKVFQNLRASFAVDIGRNFPAHVEQRWLGHSGAVARAHYLHVLDADLQRAAMLDLDAGQATRNPTQRDAATTGADRHRATETPDDAMETASCQTVPTGAGVQVAPLGFEPRTKRL